MKLTTPIGWKVKVCDAKWHLGPFGYYWSKKKRIEIYPPAWIPKMFGLRKKFIELTLNHELGHARGIKGCRKPWCLMFEAEMWEEKYKDVWWERLVATFFGLFTLWSFCKEHKSYLRKKAFYVVKYKDCLIKE